jgi:hypothetical protein
MNEQMTQASANGSGDLQSLISGADTWTIE